MKRFKITVNKNVYIVRANGYWTAALELNKVMSLKDKLYVKVHGVDDIEEMENV